MIQNSHPEVLFEGCTIERNKTLGEGCFGTVYRGQYNGQDVAIKEMRELLNGCKNPYFEKQLEQGRFQMTLICDDLVSTKQIFQCDHPTYRRIGYIVMELCDGDLRQKQQQIKKFSRIQTLSILIQIANGLNYLHQKGFAHRDIKLENIFFINDPTNPKEFTVKLGNFGLTKNIEEDLSTMIGTQAYMAPEQLQLSKPIYEDKVDIWSLGVIAHELMTGQVLFQSSGQNYQESLRLAITNFIGYQETCEDAKKNRLFLTSKLRKSFFDLPKEFVAVVNLMLKRDPQNRISAKEVSHMFSLIKLDIKPQQKININPNRQQQPQYYQTINFDQIDQSFDQFNNSIYQQLQYQKEETLSLIKNLNNTNQQLIFELSQSQNNEQESQKQIEGMRQKIESQEIEIQKWKENTNELQLLLNQKLKIIDELNLDLSKKNHYLLK